jgi:PAS domain S-box-containing protein
MVLAAIAAATLLAPPTRDAAEKLLNRYVYRRHTDYQRVIREASAELTRVLDLKTLLGFIARTVATSTATDGAATYLQARSGESFARAAYSAQHSSFSVPEVAPEVIVATLSAVKQPVVSYELSRIPGGQPVAAALADLHWSLVLPIISEGCVIGAIVVGPKLSGDPFYPQDLDLLMTLANQAGIAIKNAQLYTQVVLANEYIENIVATIESGVVAVDSTRQVTMFNRTAEQLSGLRLDNIRLRTLEVLPRVLADLLAGTLADGRARTLPEFTLSDGAVSRPVMCTTSPLRDPSGELLGAVAVFSDLTALKDLEQQRRQAERLAYLQLLASSLAHEIKNPLVAIKTFAQLIPRRVGNQRFADDFSRIVTREIARMERLLVRLRTLSHPSDRPKQPLDLRAVLLDAIEFVQPFVEERRIALRPDVGSQPRLVVGDHAELEEMFINLLLNAREATPPGGAISVDVEGADDQVMVAVSDTGPGVPAELLERIFDPFFTTKPDGTGLGLAICTSIAAGHRAKLRVANRSGGGAIFTVELPLIVGVPAPLSA